ncbi:DUF1798 family protein [Alkalihalobacillus sp. LMS39]|uniref:DUF1798 family protein n=1 Tax=Alkalihalobacillus sp. LMS39 TaxID=2924032 RepID=UPI001FB464BE|nr:DUF1798 family protein [Alkalihalobacillus sp. LMS39]UOE92295.1 YppE family protein [Alkalihalobacillus sp. LMS39]
MDNHKQLRFLSLTKELRKLTKKMYDFVDIEMTKERYEERFFTEFKPFADEVHYKASEWKELAMEWVDYESPKYIYTMQITNLFDNITGMAITVCQPRARKKNVIETIKSIEYILQTIESQMHVSIEGAGTTCDRS